MSMVITLNSETKYLYAKLGEAKTTNEVMFDATYADSTSNGSALVEGNTQSVSNGVTGVVVVNKPAAATKRDIRFVTIYNNDTVSHTIIFYKYDSDGGTTTTYVGRGVLAAATSCNLDDLISSSVNGSTTIYRRYMQITCVDYTTDVTVADGKGYLHIPADLNGMNLVEIHFKVITAGTTNSTTFTIYNLTDSTDMLSVAAAIETGETGTDTSATPGTIDVTHDDVATNDWIEINCDSASTTKPKGLVATLGFAPV
jgi:hypothetical protein